MLEVLIRHLVSSSSADRDPDGSRDQKATSQKVGADEDDDWAMDEEELVIDSPDQSPVEDEDLEDVEEPFKLGSPQTGTAMLPKGTGPPRDKDGNREQFLTYPESLPYTCESLAEMDAQLELIVQRISQAILARDYDIGFLSWNHRLECWLSLKYPMKRTVRAKVARLYYELAVLPGMDPRIVEVAANTCMTLLANKKRIDINDLQLPWQPLYHLLEHELFPKKRKTGITNISLTLLTLTEYCQRFFPPHEAADMLSTFLPRLDGSSLNSILATQSFLAHFLPVSHPQEWLQPSFVLWEAFSNSQIYTEQWLDVMSRLAEKHMDPSISDPKLVEKFKRLYERNNRPFTSESNQEQPNGLPQKRPSPEAEAGPSRPIRPASEEEPRAATSVPGEADMEIEGWGLSAPVDPASASAGRTRVGAAREKWKGIRKDVGIFSYEQWDFLMQRTLRAMNIPVGNVQKSNSNYISQGEFGAANADSAANSTVMKMKKPSERLHSSAILLIYSMANDSPVLAKTPSGSKQPSRTASSTDLRMTGKDEALNPFKLVNGSTKAYVGGSKALDSLVKLINATETFFHPSNYGHWSLILARFLQNITWEFTKRWMEEEKPDCKTPKEWRLTPRIRREFVLATRQVAFLAMFSKEGISMGCAQSALKSMSFLEPDLVLPAVLERSFPALQGLLETHRTTACIGALSSVALPLVSRSNYAAGAKHLLPLLDLCIPGLDVNDPVKTLSTVAFFIQALSTVKIDDMTQLEALQDSGSPRMTLDGVREPTPPPSFDIEDVDADPDAPPKLSKEEEDALVRESTADFPEWIAKFFKAVLALYDNLPEPGRSGRAGGKLEESMISTVTLACDFVLGQSSPAIYDMALTIFCKHVVGAPKTNSGKAIGHLAACFGRADPAKAMAALLPVCVENIRTELQHGASSTRTTSSSTPIESDNAFHWNCLLLLGALHMAAEESLKYKDQLLSILSLMREKCFSEKGYSYTGRLLQAILASLTSIWPREGRSANPEIWNSEEFKHKSHLHWGDLYTAAEVKIDWHMPTDDQVNFAIQLLQEIVQPATVELEGLVQAERPLNKEWRNDFNRYTNLVRAGLAGVASLTAIVEPETRGEDISDQGDEDLDFIRYYPRCNYGAYLTDPSDPRLQFLVSLKTRMQKVLHQAIVRLSSVDDKSEDAIDSVKMAISTSKAVMLNHPMDRNSYAAIKANFTFARDLAKYTLFQKKFPRLIWVRRASLYHASRLRLNTFYRVRSADDDRAIRDIAELTMSKYVSVRKSAQRALDSITHLYDGTRSILMPMFFEALKPGSDPDRMKGALYVLGSKSFGNMAILDWSIGPTYIMKLLQCQHEQKPSVQQLVKVVTQDFFIRLAEPSTIKLSVSSHACVAAAREVHEISKREAEPALIERLSQHNQSRIQQRNEAYERLVPDLLAVAKNPQSHWRYVLTATRFLRALIRRDQPLQPEMCAYLVSQVVSELPNQRTTAIYALTKILHFVKLRTYCESAEDLLLQRTKNPLKHQVAVPEPADPGFTDAFLAKFREPLSAESTLVDKLSTGWLVWGDKFSAYSLNEQGEAHWDESSRKALEIMREQLVSASFWQEMLKHLSQEHTRDYLALDNVTVIKSIFQIFQDEPLDAALPLVNKMLADNDRHKQRAVAEFIGGLLRGAKHWPMSKQKKVHDWLTPIWPKIFESINLDTQPAWEMLVEYVLGGRDPRRNESLMSFLTSLTIDVESSEAFKEARKGYLIGSTMKALSWHFTPWVPLFSDSFWNSITSPYTEIRLAVSDSLRYLSELRLHPSFPSTEAFLAACHRRDGMALLIAMDEDYTKRIDDLVSFLEKARGERQPFAKDAVQPYDAACLTILTWLWGSINDYRVTTVYPFVERLLPELMHMQDMQDNQELQKWASVVLAGMASLPYPESRVGPVLETLLSLFKSPSWRTRLAVLPLLQVFFFHQLFSLSEDQIRGVVSTLCNLLRDNHIEVREAAATTLSGIVRCSQREAVLDFKNRFLTMLKKTPVPGKKDTTIKNQDAFQENLLDAHAAVLGASALVLAWPYEVPSWLPELMLAAATKFSTSRAPVSTTVKDLLAQFRKTHQDTWAEDQKKFTSEQLQDLNDLVIGTSYYA